MAAGGVCETCAIGYPVGDQVGVGTMRGLQAGSRNFGCRANIVVDADAKDVANEDFAAIETTAFSVLLLSKYESTVLQQRVTLSECSRVNLLPIDINDNITG